MAETVVIDIEARYRDKTSAGTRGTEQDMERLRRKISQTEDAGRKANAALDKIGQTAARIAKKTITIPVKILDYATKPLRSLVSYATSLKGILTGVVMGQVGQNLFIKPTQYAESLKSHKLAFENLLGSAQKASQMVKDIQAFDEKSPFNTMQIIEQSRMLMTYKLANENNVLQMIETIGDAAMGVGAGDAGIERIVRALGQMKAKGKVSAEEMLQLSEINLSGWQYLADAYGVDTATIQQMTSKNKIPVEDAINALLAGMRKDFGGMAQTNASKTLGGLWGQISSVLENGPMLRWGEGLDEGAMLAASAAGKWLEESKDAITGLGEELYALGKGASTYAAEKFIQFGDRVKEVLNSEEFKHADGLGGKLRIAWDKVIAEPFSEWWNTSGEAFLGDVAGKIGSGLGKFYKGSILTLLGIDAEGAAEGGLSIGAKFAEGFLDGFDAEKVWTGIKNAFGRMVGSAAKIIPGGEKATGGSYLSAAVLALGASKLLGAGKPLLGGLGATVGGAGGAGGLLGSLGALGIGTAAGGLLGGLGLTAAGADVLAALNSGNTDKARNVFGWQAGTRLGMVGAGAAAGAGIGSLFGGIGAIPGMLLGAGVGGLGALLGGGRIGERISDLLDGSAKVKDTTKALADTGSALDAITAKSRDTEALLGKFDELHRKLSSGKLSTEELATAQSELRTTAEELARAYPNLLSQYDIENGKLAEKVSLIRQVNAAQREQARRDAEMAVYEGQKDLPRLMDDMASAKNKQEAAIQEYEQQMAMVRKAQEIEGLLKTRDTLSGAARAEMTRDISAKIADWNRMTGDSQGELGFYEGLSGDYLKRAGSAYDRAGKYGAELDSSMGQVQERYMAKLRLALLPQNVDLADMQSKAGRYAELESQTAALQQALTGQEKGSEAYGETTRKIAETRGEQEKLRGEMEKFREPLEAVFQLVREINNEFSILGDARLDFNAMGLGGIASALRPYGKGGGKTVPGVGGIGPAQYAYAGGTRNAPPGMAWVGERGPELMRMHGGERVYTAAESRAMTGGGGVSVNLGGLNISISGGGDGDLVEQLRARLPEIGNELCAIIAGELSRSYANMPRRVEGTA